MKELVEYTGYAIIALWILTHSAEFGTAMAALTNAGSSGVRTLFGFTG